MNDSESEWHQQGFRIRGRVQGVYFRWWTRRRAADLGLRGTVQNRPSARVEGVDGFESDGSLPTGFEII